MTIYQRAAQSQPDWTEPSGTDRGGCHTKVECWCAEQGAPESVPLPWPACGLAASMLGVSFHAELRNHSVLENSSGIIEGRICLGTLKPRCVIRTRVFFLLLLLLLPFSVVPCWMCAHCSSCHWLCGCRLFGFTLWWEFASGISAPPLNPQADSGRHGRSASGYLHTTICKVCSSHHFQ